MANTISVGELRQNPTRMLREVKAGAIYVVTDHGEPVAEIGLRREPHWVPTAELDALLRDLGGDDTWLHELEEDRKAITMASPWDQPA